MNDLTPLPPNAPPARQITTALSLELSRLLDSAQSDDFSAGQIAGRAELRGELIAALPAMKQAALAPAGEEGVADVVGRRFAIYPQPERSDAEWAAWWGDYYDALANLPWSALEAGMQAWVSDPRSEFMPKPGRLLELARETPNRAAKHYTRAKMVAQLCAPGRTPRPEPTEHERAQVRSMLASYQQRVADKARVVRPRPEQPSIAGKADEGGLTPAMRALVERQKEAR